jgi:[ribosomal protein S5]-alanine N-acetyltransferase
MITIETPRLVIKSYDYGEELAVLEFLLINKEHLQFVLSPWVATIDDLEKASNFIKKMKAGILLKNLYGLAIWRKSDQQLIGEVVFFKVDWAKRKMESGIYLGQYFQGQGYATEAKKACIAFFLNEYKLSRIEAICAHNNFSSQRVLERCGFFRESKMESNTSILYAIENSHNLMNKYISYL